MPKRSVLGALGLWSAVLVVATVGLQGKPPNPPPDWPLNLTLDNAVGTGVRSDADSQWCQQAPEIEIQYCDGHQNVRAAIQATGSPGNLVFDTNNDDSVDGLRRLHLDFAASNALDQMYPFGNTTAFDVDTYIATLGETLSSSDPSLMTMAQGVAVKKRMRLSWVSGNRRYSLRWDADTIDDFVNFTCNVSLNLSCSEWTAMPLTSAELYSVPTKGKPTETYHGEYSMPFSMTLVRQ